MGSSHLSSFVSHDTSRSSCTLHCTFSHCSVFIYVITFMQNHTYPSFLEQKTIKKILLSGDVTSVALGVQNLTSCLRETDCPLAGTSNWVQTALQNQNQIEPNQPHHTVKQGGNVVVWGPINYKYKYFATERREHWVNFIMIRKEEKLSLLWKYQKWRAKKKNKEKFTTSQFC